VDSTYSRVGSPMDWVFQILKSCGSGCFMQLV
jgi:hypothetical protein